MQCLSRLSWAGGGRRRGGRRAAAGWRPKRLGGSLRIAAAGSSAADHACCANAVLRPLTTARGSRPPASVCVLGALPRPCAHPRAPPTAPATQTNGPLQRGLRPCTARATLGEGQQRGGRAPPRRGEVRRAEPTRATRRRAGTAKPTPALCVDRCAAMADGGEEDSTLFWALDRLLESPALSQATLDCLLADLVQRPDELPDATRAKLCLRLLEGELAEGRVDGNVLVYLEQLATCNITALANPGIVRPSPELVLAVRTVFRGECAGTSAQREVCVTGARQRS